MTLRKILQALSLSSLIFFMGCDSSTGSDDQQGGDKSVAAVVINSGGLTLSEGSTEKLSATSFDLNGNEVSANIIWKSENSNVAMVNASGEVKITGEGVTTITAKVDMGVESVWWSIPVIGTVPTIFDVYPWAYTGDVNYEFTIEPLMLDLKNSASYSFSSSNGSVASVTSNGVVTLNASGEAVITVTGSKDGKTIGVKQIPVVVVKELPVIDVVYRVSVEKTNSDYIFKGDKINLSATAYTLAEKKKTEGFTWGSSDESVATVNTNGEITAKKVGECMISATLDGVTGQCNIEVFPDTIVLVTPFMNTLEPGESKQLTATAYNAKTGEPFNDVTEFTWDNSSDIFGDMFKDMGDFDNPFGGINVNSSGLVTVDQSAMEGISAIIVAMVPGNEESAGASMVNVMTGGIDIDFPVTK